MSATAQQLILDVMWFKLMHGNHLQRLLDHTPSLLLKPCYLSIKSNGPFHAVTVPDYL